MPGLQLFKQVLFTPNKITSILVYINIHIHMLLIIVCLVDE